MDSKKRKKQYYKNSVSKRSRRNEDLKPGVKGFIITANQRERNAVVEGYHLLNEYADKKYGPEKLEDSGSECDDIDIEEALKKEVDGIKNANNPNKGGILRRFLSVKTKANNVVFIKTTLPDPVELLDEIFNDIINSQIRKSKFCLRFLPIIDTCYAKPDEIVKAAKPLIIQHFHQCVIPFTFCIMWKVRCNNTLKRDDVLPKLVEFIYSEDNGQKTDYANPEVVFNLDIIGNICCFGLLRNYHKYKKYNIDLLVSDAVKVKEDAKITEEGDASVDAHVDANVDANVEKADRNTTEETIITDKEETATVDVEKKDSINLEDKNEEKLVQNESSVNDTTAKEEAAKKETLLEPKNDLLDNNVIKKDEEHRENLKTLEN